MVTLPVKVQLALAPRLLQSLLLEWISIGWLRSELRALAVPHTVSRTSTEAHRSMLRDIAGLNL